MHDHLSSCNLLNGRQPAYVRFHYTETAMLSLGEHAMRATSLQQATGLCPLDLSAVFDTVDHAILLFKRRFSR